MGAKKGHIVKEETRRKLRIKLLGNKNGVGNKGHLGTHPSEETLKKLSLIHKGKPLSENHKRNISLGEKGKYVSDQTRKNLSISHLGTHSRLGIRTSEKTKDKIRLLKIGNKNRVGICHSNKAKKKMSLAKIGNPGPWLGKHRSEETKKKLSEATKFSWDNMNEEQKRAFMKKITSSIHRVSIPQRDLFEFLKQIFPDAQLEYPVRTLETYRFADIGIPSLKVAFEYDGFFLHNAHSYEANAKRDAEFAAVGWATFRITKDSLKLLSKQKIFEMVNTNKT